MNGYHLTKAILESPDLGSEEKLVLSVMATFCGDPKKRTDWNVVWPGRDTLMNLTKLTARRLKYRIEQLEEKDWLKCIDHGGPRHAAHYRIRTLVSAADTVSSADNVGTNRLLKRPLIDQGKKNPCVSTPGARTNGRLHPSIMQIIDPTWRANHAE